MRSKIMKLVLVSGVVVAMRVVSGCGSEPATGYDMSWLKYQQTDSNKGSVGVVVTTALTESQAALGESAISPPEHMSGDALKKVQGVCVNFYGQNFEALHTALDNGKEKADFDKSETAFNEKCAKVSELLYSQGEANSALQLDGGNSQFGVVHGALESGESGGETSGADESGQIDIGFVPGINAVWGTATIKMTDIQQGIAGAIDVVGGMVQGVTNRILCLTELGVRVMPNVSQGLLDDYGPDSAEGECKLCCVTTVTLPAALWCMAYPENFGSNSEFDPDTLWQEIDSYLHATCDGIEADYMCIYC